MRKQFDSWLKNYKEYKSTKALNILKRVDKISDDAVQAQAIESGLFHCKSFIEYAKKRSSVIKKISLNPSEKNALDLLGDFFQVFDYRKPNYQIDTAPELQTYCSNIKIFYSYKPVFIWVMLELKANDSPSSLDDICQRMIKFYSSRLEKGLIAEKADSIFSRESYDYTKAKQVIKSNPLTVLQKDKVVYFDAESQRVGFTSQYCPNESEVAAIKQICVDKLKSYYDELSSNNQSNPSQSNRVDVYAQIIKTIDELDAIITTTHDPEKLKTSHEYIDKLRKIWDKSSTIDLIPIPVDDTSENTVVQAEGTVEETSIPKLELIKETDPRKIGKLVRETMTNLEICGFRFEDQLLLKMQDPEWSKKTLKLYFPFLKGYDPSSYLDVQIKDKNGNGRFWKQIFSFSGKKYLVTSEWYKESKPLFIQWFNSLIGNSDKNDTSPSIQETSESLTDNAPEKMDGIIYRVKINVTGRLNGEYYLISYKGKLKSISSGSTKQHYIPLKIQGKKEKLIPVSLDEKDKVIYIPHVSFAKFRDIILSKKDIEIRKTYFN